MRMLHACTAMLAVSTAVSAQSAAPPPSPLQFEVATIRRNVVPETGGEMRIEPSGQIAIRNYTLFDIVRNAYGVQPFQIVTEGAPDWFGRDRWNIIAKPPDKTDESQRIAMLQNLLADRFTLIVKRETREMPVYALVLARADGRLGPQLRPSSGECEALRAARTAGTVSAAPQPARGFCGTRAGAGRVSTSGVPLASFARNLAPLTGRFVVDRTGLTGAFDLDLKWTPDLAAGDRPASGALADGTSLFAAIQEQLGLKLEAQRAPVEAIVIESAQRPVED